MRETRKNTDAKKAIVRSVTPGKGREGGLCSMKAAEEENWKLRAQEYPLGHKTLF